MNNLKEITKKLLTISGFPRRSTLNQKSIQQHYLIGDWTDLFSKINKPTYNKVVVLEDVSSLIYWANKVGKNNVSFWHYEEDFVDEVAKTGISTFKDLNMIPQNVPQVGNPAFSIAEDVFLRLPTNQEICMVMPAWVAVAPTWEAQSWGKKREIKQHLEKIGLKELYWIPNATFEQVDTDGKINKAQVDSVLVITEPGYTGDVTVTDLEDGASYIISRGGIYPRRQETLNYIERFDQGNTLKWTAEQKNNFTATQWTIGVNEQNPYAKSKGKNGPHLKGLKIFAPGDQVKKNTCYCIFDNEIDAKNAFAKLTSDDIANAYQLVTTKRTISSVVLRMLKI
jgi:hypothetical protein